MSSRLLIAGGAPLATLTVPGCSERPQNETADSASGEPANAETSQRREPVAYTVTGEPLFPSQLSDEPRARLEANLGEARAA